MKCLMNYVEEFKMGKILSNSGEYIRSLHAASEAYELLTGKLTPAQVKNLEDYCAKRDQVNAQEDEELFYQGVLIGKWMVWDVRFKSNPPPGDGPR